MNLRYLMPHKERVSNLITRYKEAKNVSTTHQPDTHQLDIVLLDHQKKTIALPNSLDTITVHTFSSATISSATSRTIPSDQKNNRLSITEKLLEELTKDDENEFILENINHLEQAFDQGGYPTNKIPRWIKHIPYLIAGLVLTSMSLISLGAAIQFGVSGAIASSVLGQGLVFIYTQTIGALITSTPSGTAALALSIAMLALSVVFVTTGATFIKKTLIRQDLFENSLSPYIQPLQRIFFHLKNMTKPDFSQKRIENHNLYIGYRTRDLVFTHWTSFYKNIVEKNILVSEDVKTGEIHFSYLNPIRLMRFGLYSLYTAISVAVDYTDIRSQLKNTDENSIDELYEQRKESTIIPRAIKSILGIFVQVIDLPLVIAERILDLPINLLDLLYTPVKSFYDNAKNNVVLSIKHKDKNPTPPQHNRKSSENLNQSINNSGNNQPTENSPIAPYTASPVNFQNKQTNFAPYNRTVNIQGKMTKELCLPDPMISQIFTILRGSQQDVTIDSYALSFKQSPLIKANENVLDENNCIKKEHSSSKLSALFTIAENSETTLTLELVKRSELQNKMDYHPKKD